MLQDILKFVLVFVSLIKALEGADSNDITRLRAYILNNYDTHSRPVQKLHNVTTVETSFYLSGGFEFDDQLGKLTLRCMVMLIWEDQHVKWDPVNFGNLSDLTFFPTELWRPDLSVLNNYDESEIDHYGNTLMVAKSDSSVWWIPPAEFIVGCQTDFRLWPYDTQTCYIWLSSWTYHGGEVDLIIPENATKITETNEFPESREWNMVDSSVTRGSETYGTNITFVYVSIKLSIQRRSSVHTSAITMVGLGIAAAVLISFWLDPFANERLPMTLLVILINAMYLQCIHQIIPNNGNSVPLAICFFRDSLIMVTFGLAWTVGIRYLAKTKRNSPVPLPEFLQSFLNSIGATVLCLNPRPTTKGQIQRKNTENSEEDGEVSELVEEDNSIQEDWEWLARLVDRIAFIAYLITYTIFIVAFL
ncbi:unnamed protein product [Orchesella dallaii]